MQPCSREEHAMNSLLSPPSAHSSEIQNGAFDPSPPQDDFLDQILSTLPPSSWSSVDPTDETSPPSDPAAFHPAVAHFFDKSSALLMMINHNDAVDCPPSQALYNTFAAGSLHGGGAPNQPHHFHHPQGTQDLGAQGGAMNQGQGLAPQASSTTTATGTATQTKPRVRARRGQATDPHSIAERLRRERIAERMKALQELVPNANKTDKASMLDEIIDYVKFLQLQVKVLSMSRLGGAAAVAPLVSEIGGGCVEVSGSHGKNQTASSNNDNSLTMTEHQVAKLMEEDMGSAMQYLQGKGLCLMPISLATAISTATCQPSPNISALTLQSSAVGNGAADGPASVSKP